MILPCVSVFYVPWTSYWTCSLFCGSLHLGPSSFVGPEWFSSCVRTSLFGAWSSGEHSSYCTFVRPPKIRFLQEEASGRCFVHYTASDGIDRLTSSNTHALSVRVQWLESLSHWIDMPRPHIISSACAFSSKAPIAVIIICDSFRTPSNLTLLYILLRCPCNDDSILSAKHDIKATAHAEMSRWWCLEYSDDADLYSATSRHGWTRRNNCPHSRWESTRWKGRVPWRQRARIILQDHVSSINPFKFMRLMVLFA